MKKIIFTLIAFVLLSISLCACGEDNATEVSSNEILLVSQSDQSSSAVSSEKISSAEQQGEESKTEKKTTPKKEESSDKATLYLVNGSGTEKKQITWSGDFLDSKFLIEELSKFSGVNMNCADAFSGKGGISVDFDDSSPIFGGTLYVSENSKIKFSDYDSSTWCILDSIYKTLQENNGGNVDVYFSYKGGAMQLKTTPEVTIDATKPYKGSGAYLK